MKEKIEKDGGARNYVCERCGFVYSEREWAKKCEAWCSKYQGCNLDITQHALETAQRNQSLREGYDENI
jgi:hypothetical protein